MPPNATPTSPTSTPRRPGAVTNPSSPCSPVASNAASCHGERTVDALVDRLAGPVLHRRFISALPLDRAFGEFVVDAVLGTT